MPIISTSVGRARPLPHGSLKTRVARIVGGANEPEMLAAASECINDAIIEFNSRLYECNKIGPTAITLTDGEGDLPTLFYKELECSWVDSSGTRIRQLNYIDWAEYRHVYFTQTFTANIAGTPGLYTLFNTHLTGKIKVLPEDNLSSTSYIKISYYRRLALLDSDDDVLDAPQEIQRALVLKAQADILRIFKSGDPNAFTATAALAENAWNRFSAIDTKHPDQKPRFRLPPLTINRGPFGQDVIYIKG